MALNDRSLTTWLVQGFTKTIDRMPAARRITWRAIYDFLAWRFPHPGWTFMNYGYSELDDGQATTPEHPPEDGFDRYSIQLYRAVIGGYGLAGKNVLEVGCGRGGGASWIARTQGVHAMTGLDLSPQATRFCQRNHRHPRLRFRQGSADALPFPNSSFDAVLNIESAHHYPSLEDFAREVFRVLKPGGHFHFACPWTRDDLAELTAAFQAVSFQFLEEEDITANVLAALELGSHAREAMIDTHFPIYLRGVFKNFASLPGTAIYRTMKEGEGIYHRLLLRKPTAPPA